MKIYIFLMLSPIIFFDHKINGMNLLYAVKNNNITQAETLLNNKADVNVQDGDGNTPLHLAVMNENVGMVSLLLSRLDIMIDKPNAAKMTAFHIAFLLTDKKIVELLLDRRADCTQPTSFLDCTLYPSRTSFVQEAQPSYRLQKIKLAFAMALCPRTAVNSPTKILSQHLVQEILSYLSTSTDELKTPEKDTPVVQKNRALVPTASQQIRHLPQNNENHPFFAHAFNNIKHNIFNK